MPTFSNSISSPPPQQRRGLLGLGGFGGSQPPAGLLGRYFDPAEERRRKISGLLSGAGLALLQGGRGNFGEVLGQGLAGGLQGLNQARDDYLSEAFNFHQYEQQQADRQRQIENDQFNRDRLTRQDAWTSTQNQRTLEEQQRTDEERQAQKASIIEWANQKESSQPGFLEWAQNFPEEAAKVYAAEMTPPAGEGFTLGEGQVRYDATGRPIASGAPKLPEPFTLGADQTRYDAMGRPIAAGVPKRPEPFTLSEGQVRFGPDGKQIAAGLPKTGTGSGVEYGLQPIITQEPPGPNGEPGKYHLFQAAKDGSPPKEIPLPYGWTPQQQYLDTGLGYQAAPRQGMGNGAVIPKNVWEEAATREGGKQSEAVPAQAVQEYLKPNGVKEQDDATLNSISSIHEARRMLEQGIQTGALATKLQSLRSLGYALGFEVDERVLIDTETYQNFIRQTVIPKMKELGGNDSNEELRKMELLSGADINQQNETLRNTLNLTEKLLARKFKSRELYRKATKKYFGDSYEIPELPTYNTTPQGGKVIDGYTIRRVQ